MFQLKALQILIEITEDSIDYIFTDPPYADNVQYGELNFIWEAWLDFDTHWHDQEIIVNETRGKTDIDWAELMHQAMTRMLSSAKTRTDGFLFVIMIQVKAHGNLSKI